MELERSFGPKEHDDAGTKHQAGDSLAPRLESNESRQHESRGRGAISGLAVAGTIAAVLLGCYCAYKGVSCAVNSEAVQRTIWQAEESIKNYGR